MTAESKAAVLTARRATQHIRLFKPNDAYECLCILTVLPEPSPVSALCWQIHRRLAVLAPLLRVWVHCPRASNGLLPRRSNLVGYVRWDERSDRVPPLQTIIFSSFPGRTIARHPTRIARMRHSRLQYSGTGLLGIWQEPILCRHVIAYHCGTLALCGIILGTWKVGGSRITASCAV